VRGPLLKRVAEFLRSVIPADPFQLLFLAGVACLVVAHGLWWPGIGPFVALGVWPIIFAGASGYFICFWPGKHPVRRILGLVFLPTIAGLGLMFGAFAFLHWPSSSSVLESTGSVLVHRIHWAQSMLGKLPPGVQFSLIGLLLIAIFTSRLAFGIATLPLALSGRHALQAEDSESWRRPQFLIWFLVGIAFLPIVLLSFLTLGVPLLLTSRLLSFVQSDLFPRLSVIPETIVAHATRATGARRETSRTFNYQLIPG
jgi:hypothetical protein